ncbi:hypothetical protein AB7G19_29960 [Bradyrhizobium sp. 215_C5_N1_1]|uniref:hypothetical protein n=1 Tax=unclassified Bradyrhizobium TaxID=2631580 RepID=UPI003F8A70BE
MPAPALRIPVSLNMDEFDKGVERAKTGTRQATQFVLKQFAEMNASLGGPAAAGLFAGVGASALQLVGIFGAVVTAAKLVGMAIDGVRGDLEEMVKVAEGAQRTGLTPQFFQAFIAGAKGAEAEVETFTAALDKAFQATKPTLNPDWSVWDQGVTKVNAVEKALTEMREMFSTSDKFTALDLFRQSGSQDDRIRAVITGMKELNAIGQQVAALDLGEKMFGAKFVDGLRQGKTSIDDIARTIETKLQASDIISNASAMRAKEIDDRLNDAWNTITNNLKPSWQDLDGIALKIKDTWASIVGLIAEASAAGPRARDRVQQLQDQASSVESQLNDPESAVFVNPNLLRQRQRMLAARGQPFSAAPSGMFSEFTDFPGIPKDEELFPRARNGAALLPRPRPSDAPKPPEEKAEQRDQFDVSIDAINKHIATLNADTAAMFQNNASRAQLRAEFQALTAIVRDEGEVTQEQIDKYEKLRQSMSAQQALEAAGIQLTKEHSDAFLAASRNIRQAADQHDQAALSLQRLNSASASIGGALETAFADAVVEGKDLNAVLVSLEKQLAKMAINSVFSSFFNAPATGGLSTFGSILKGIGIPGFADGTSSAPGGLAWVGERGPELMNVPKGAQILPADISRQVAGGSTLHITNQIAGEINPATIERMNQAQIATQRKLGEISKVLISTERMQATGVG